MQLLMVYAKTVAPKNCKRREFYIFSVIPNHDAPKKNTVEIEADAQFCTLST